MQTEHEVAGEDLQFFHKITNNYLLPEDACNSYNLLFEKMKEFEDDLIQHIHLENNILFPKAIKLDDELAGKN
jgi:regulator of cell morphogenesis and NO signaling